MTQWPRSGYEEVSGEERTSRASRLERARGPPRLFCSYLGTFEQSRTEKRRDETCLKNNLSELVNERRHKRLMAKFDPK